MTTSIEDLAERFRQYASPQVRSASPLYARLTVGIAELPEIMALVQQHLPNQPPPNLLFGAVHDLLLTGAEHPLRDYYPNLTPAVKQGDPLPIFRDFCLQYATQIQDIVQTRLVQTNEVGRCALLLPAFNVITQQTQGTPLALVEVGSSAGLNLNWDHYTVHYSNGQTFTPDVPAGVMLQCDVRGKNPPIPTQTPAVAWRVGIDLNPMDVVKNANDEAWLRALIWPEDATRFERFDHAVTFLKQHPVRLLAGDALALLPQVLDEAPQDAVLCVFHSLVLYQFTHEMKTRFYEILADHAQHRPIYDVAVEWTEGNVFEIRLRRYENSTLSETNLANFEPHGRYIEWLGAE